MTSTLLATGARILWRVIEAHGLDADAIFRDAGLDPALLNEPRGRYPLRRASVAWTKAGQLSGVPHIGLEAARHYRLTDFHALGIAFQSSSTLLMALERLDRHETIVNSGLDFSIVHAGSRIDLVCDPLGLDGDALRINEDIRAALVVDLCRSGAEGVLDPTEVAFTYPPPEQTDEYDRFFRCPVRFSASVNRISFAEADGERPFTSMHPELARMNDQLLDRMAKSLRESEVIRGAKAAIIAGLPSGTPKDDEIAKALLLSARTFQRKLAEQGTNFTELLGQVRRELAEHYIADPDIPVTEISYLLGFSDVSSFSRAFKRWTGSPPAAFRDRAATA
jgi:AraC-like DNA-binding protein